MRILNRVKETVDELQLKAKKVAELMKKFYDKIDYNVDYGTQAWYDLLDYGDEWMENKDNQPFLNSICKARAFGPLEYDYVTSDREVIAMVFALIALGYIDKKEFRPETINYINNFIKK